MRRTLHGVVAALGLAGFAGGHLLASAAAAQSDAGPAPSAPAVENVSPNGYRVRVPIGEVRVLHGDVDDVPLDEILLPGGSDLSEPGAPQIPTRLVWLRVPWGVAPRVRATPGPARSLGLLRPTPIPKLLSEGRERAARAVVDVRNALAAPAYTRAYAADPLRKVTMAAAGGTRILAVEIAPVRWDATTGSAWQFEEITLEVSWDGAVAPVSPIPSDAPGPSRRDGFAAERETVDPADAAGPLYAPRLAGGGASAARSAAPPGTPLRVDPTRPWVRLATTRPGLYRVTAADLATAGVAVASIDPATLRLFRATPGDLPESVDVDLGPDSLRECAIEVAGDGDGTFDPADAVTFYGTGAFGFGHDLSKGGTSDYLEAMRTFEASYWLTWGVGPVATPPLRVTSRAAAPVTIGAPLVTEVTHRVHVGQNRFYAGNLFQTGVRWERWFDRSIGAGTRIAYPIALPGALPGGAGSLRLRLWGDGSSIGTSIPDHVARASWNSALVDSQGWDFSLVKDLAGSGFAVGLAARDTLEVGVPKITDPADKNRSDFQWVAWFEVDYPRRLQASADTLYFAAPDSVPAGRYQYRLSAIVDSAAVRLYDRTDPERLERLSGGVWGGSPGNFVLTVEDSAGPGYRPRYALLSATRTVRPSAIALYAPVTGPRTLDDLLDAGNQADYVVIAPPSFAAAAESLAADRSAALTGIVDPAAVVATTDRIYAQFAGGTPDATALRNFLTYAARHWARAPLYVCLLGDASLDPLNYSGIRAADLVPTYPNGFHPFLDEQFSMDDWLVRLDGPSDPLLDLAVGRLPARTPEEALQMVRGKRRVFESSTSFDPARNRVFLCADDAWKYSKPLMRDLVGLDHVRQMERKDDFHIPFPEFRSKVYLNDYAFSDSTKQSKPEAREAFIAAVNAGSWLVDFVGHGSGNLIADEQVFRSIDIPRLTNSAIPPIWAFMSCTVGKFDDHSGDGMAELLLRAPSTGAVAALAATGEVFGIESSALNDAFVDELFPARPRVDSLVTAGLAWARAKNRSVNFSVRKYNLLGEPGVRPPVPRGRGVWEKAPLDSVLRGDLVTLRGHALEPDGSPDTTSNGTARLRILGPPSRRVEFGFQGGNPGTAPYDLPGPVLYQGDVPLANGAFQITFTVPVDARVAGGGARLEGLLERAGGLGVGVAADTIRIASLLSPRIDVTPPTITLLSPSDTTYAPGDRVTIALEDSSGIDLTRLDNAHAIFVLFDETGSPIDLTAGFVYETGSATRGSVVLTLPSLADGPHRLEIHASDTFRNIGAASYVLEVARSAEAGGALQLSQVFNYPNPFQNSTYVHLRLNQPARVRIQVLTVAGRKIREWHVDGKSGENYFPWDGLDSEGEKIAIGVYLIHVTAEAAGGGKVDAVARALRTG
ncbi:MAG TPA: C25 family cysteine peptidase [Candidatus Eisenbacteria bacterium]|nr:C25 family cysteine peptidase [Candidatus Eisenbacteria bacterium]